MNNNEVHFTVYPHRINKAGKWVFYAHFYDPDTGKRLPAISTKQTSRRDAQDWCVKEITSGRRRISKGITFEVFTESWWIYGECEYIARRLGDGASLGRTYAATKRSELERHLRPFFNSYRLDRINIRLIERFKKELRAKDGRYRKPLSNKTINNIMGNLHVILSEALRLEYIDRDPMKGVSSLSDKSKPRQILTPGEVKELFDETTIQKVWNGNLQMYTINLLAATTGMRMGECQALKLDAIDFDKGFIKIQYSWERQYGLKEPKCASYRVVPIPERTSRYLKLVADFYQVSNEGLVFANQSDPHTPVDHKTVLEGFYAAIGMIGIDETARKNRRVTFHSWRHFFNSMMRINIPDHILRSMTGHKSEEMTDRYTHVQIEQLDSVRIAQDDLV